MKNKRFWIFSLILVGGVYTLWALHLYHSRLSEGSQRSLALDEVFLKKSPPSDEDLQFESHMYFSYPANSRWRRVKKWGAEVIFDVEFETDEKRRRINPLNRESQRKKEVIFFGCAFASGEGVDGAENIPGQLSALAPEVYTYNYAGPGYGPGHLLSFMENYSLEQDIKDRKQASFIYIFPDFHIRRSLPTLHILANFSDIYPYYDFNSQGQLVRLGNFSKAMPWMSSLAKTLYGFSFVRGRNLDYPAYGEYSAEQLELVYKIIAKAAEIYQQKMNENFYVLFFPGYEYARDQIGPKLLANKIKILDYSQLIPKIHQERERWIIKFDEHPTAQTYEQVAKALTKDLRLSSR